MNRWESRHRTRPPHLPQGQFLRAALRWIRKSTNKTISLRCVCLIWLHFLAVFCEGVQTGRFSECACVLSLYFFYLSFLFLHSGTALSLPVRIPPVRFINCGLMTYLQLATLMDAFNDVQMCKTALSQLQTLNRDFFAHRERRHDYVNVQQCLGEIGEEGPF